MMSKRQLTERVYSEQELNSIDTATPCTTWKQFPPNEHCMNYNEPNRYGRIDNIAEVAKERNIKLFHAPKIYFTEFNNLKYIFEKLEEYSEDLKSPGEGVEFRDHIEYLKELIEFDNLEKIEE